jgi:hypothetical protein
LINCKKYPSDRCDFDWVRLDQSAVLYGGAGSPNEIYHEDMWMFKYDGFDFNSEPKKELQKDYWHLMEQKGASPGKLRAFSMEYSNTDHSIYLFGGHDSRGKNKNDLYRYNLISSTWELIETKSRSPCERCYPQIAMINKDHLVIYGGITGIMSKIDKIHSDVFVYNITDSIWHEPIIGGINPGLRFGFSMCAKYFPVGEIIIIGGHSFENDNKLMKIYVLSENGKENYLLINFKN